MPNGIVSENINNVSKAINNYQNLKTTSVTGTPGLITNFVQATGNGVGGLTGVLFPRAKNTTTNVTATLIKL